MRILIGLLSITLALVSACGGGSGGGGNDGGSASTPTPSNQSITLSGAQSTGLGTVYSTQLIGSDSNGVAYSGTYSVANRAQTMLNGVLVVPRDTLLSLSDRAGAPAINVTTTSYLDTSGNLILIVVQTIGWACAPASPDHMPSVVQVGDFGILSTLTCNDNTTLEGNWRIEDAGNGNVRVVNSATQKDRFNSIISVTESADTIDANGNIIGFKTVTNRPSSHFSLTYQSI